MPYTAFYTKKSFLENNQETLEKFNTAINKGLQYTYENSPKTIAEAIITIINRYKESDSWLTTTHISEQMVKNLEDIMIENDLLDDYVPYNDLFHNLTNE